MPVSQVEHYQNYATYVQDVIKQNDIGFSQFIIRLMHDQNIHPDISKIKKENLKITFNDTGTFTISGKISMFGKKFHSDAIPFNSFIQTLKQLNTLVPSLKLKGPTKPQQQNSPVQQQALNQSQPQQPQQPTQPGNQAPLTKVARATPLAAGQPKGQASPQPRTRVQASQVVQHQTPPPPANTKVRDERTANHRDRLEKLVNPAPLPAGTPIASLATNQSSATTAQPQYGKLPANGRDTNQNSAGNNQPVSIFGAFSATKLNAAAAAPKAHIGKIPTEVEYLRTAGQASPQAPTTGQAPSQASTQRTTVQAPSQVSPPRAASGQSVNYEQLPPDFAMRRPLPQPTAGQASETSQPAHDRRAQGVFNAQQLAADSSKAASKSAAPGPGADPARVMGKLPPPPKGPTSK